MNPGPPQVKAHLKKKNMSPAVTEIGKYPEVPYYGIFINININICVVINNKVGGKSQMAPLLWTLYKN